MAGIFKAYDIRGTVPDQLDPQLARRIGLAYRSILEGDDGPVVVSRDMRPHGAPLTEALIDGLRSAGLDVIHLGMATTPMNYFAVGHLGAAGGIQVTASHNPPAYNGFKLSRREARPVSGDTGIATIERLATAAQELEVAAESGALTMANLFDIYRDHVTSFLRRPEGARPLRVVVDCASGMGALDLPILANLGIELVPVYFELDGTFPHHEANPLKLETLRDLSRHVVETGADLGVAFDGDADRAAFVDERGEPVGSDLATALIAGELLGREPGTAIVYDLRSSHAVPEWIEEKGGVPVRERVGHSFIKATMRERESLFGGELAGHYYFRDTYYADCAVLAVVEMLNLLWKTGASLSELVEPLASRYHKSEEINFEVDDKAAKLEELARRYADATIDHLDGVTLRYDSWWANVRPSNTEPYLRLVLEASSAEELADRRQELTEILGRPV